MPPPGLQTDLWPAVTLNFDRLIHKVDLRALAAPVPLVPVGKKTGSLVFSQPSIYIDGWLYGMRMTSVVCNVPVLSQNDSTYHHSVFTT